jgi:GT2 family glycosyltransferase
VQSRVSDDNLGHAESEGERDIEATPIPADTRPPTISVCVPVYRATEPPDVALLAASMPAALGDRKGELIVALNGISAKAAGVPPEARTIDLGVNRGVAPAWNAAARLARGSTLVFANDDVVLGKGSLERLTQALEHTPKVGVVGPLGALWDLSVPRHREWVEGSPLVAGELKRCDIVSGFLMAVRHEVFGLAGGFDERFSPCTGEELDFCTTVKVRLGLDCYVVGGVEHQHEFHISSAPGWRRLSHNGRKEMLWRIHRRNTRNFRRKWKGLV